MITISGLSINFGERDILNQVNLFIGPRDRIGLVGHNGAGKSTLLKCLAGLYPAQRKSISQQKGIHIGYLPQEMEHHNDLTIIEEAGAAFEEINELEERTHKLTEELGTRDDYQTESYANLIDELEHANHRLEILGGQNRDQLTEKVLKGLGFTDEDMHRKIGEFSGGWQMRVQIAKLLLQQPELLLLDEPTNHLDIESIEWLEKFLVNYQGAIVMISHDRLFLDNVTERTVEVLAGKLYDYKLPYSRYVVQRKEEVEKQIQAYKNQQKYIEDTEKLINKFRAKKNKAAFAQTLIRKLEKMDRIEIDEFSTGAINMRFAPSPRSGKVLYKAEHLSKSYDSKKVFSGVDLTIARQDRIAIVGKNGIGKSTLMRILNKQESFDGELEIGHNIEIGYYAQNQTDELDGDKTVFETIDDVAVGDIRTQIRALLGSFLFSGEDIDKKVKVLSGGEKARLALCKLMLSPVNMLFLDEPTNHLDLRSKEILKEALLNYDGAMLVISHDRDFLHDLTHKIYEVQPKGLKEYLGDIYDFLAEKNAASIAQFEKVNKEKDKSDKSESSHQMSYKEKKEYDKLKRKLKNKITRCEKEISELEVLLEAKELEVQHLDYSDKVKTEATLKAFHEIKNTLDHKMEEWSNADAELSKLD